MESKPPFTNINRLTVRSSRSVITTPAYTSMAVFEAAFTRRFASGRTVEAALDRLSTIKSTNFADLDLFYTDFCDLISIIGSQRSKSDLVRNFLDAIPQSMRLLILVKNPGIRTSAGMAIDELSPPNHGIAIAALL